MMGLMGPAWLHLWGDACFAQSLSPGEGPGDKLVTAWLRSQEAAGGGTWMLTITGAARVGEDAVPGMHG